MKRIRLTYNFPYHPFLRQTPGGKGIWGRYRFVTDDDDDSQESEFDAWVVYNNLSNRSTQLIHCPRERTVLVIGEPPSRITIHPDFVAQFSTLVTCHQIKFDGKLLHSQQSLPWWVGVQRNAEFEFKAVTGYDELAAMKSITKTRQISIICSNLAITPQHRLRLRFLKDLTRRFGEQIEIFGLGFRPVRDKWEAIAPFKYHIVLENSFVADYWTEKLADAFLGAAMPIYWGCPNIDLYFSQESMTRIDIGRPADAIRIIENVLANDPYEEKRAAIWESRRQVLEEYNFFSVIARLVDGLATGLPQPILLLPTSAFRPTIQMMLSRRKNLIREYIARKRLRAAGLIGL
jgi:hypothetical protein